MSIKQEREDRDRDSNSASDSVDDFVNFLLASEPKAPNEVHLEIDTEDSQGLYEFLLTLTMKVLVRWHGVPTPSGIRQGPVNLAEVPLSDFKRLIDYLISFGFRLDASSIDEPAVYLIDNKSYLHETVLDKMYFQTAVSGRLWTIRFSIFV
jgi:hypothetical protein